MSLWNPPAGEHVRLNLPELSVEELRARLAEVDFSTIEQDPQLHAFRTVVNYSRLHEPTCSHTRSAC